jgi:hypothetical protein
VQGLGDMIAANVVHAGKVGNCAGDLAHAIVPSRAQSQTLHGVAQHPDPRSIQLAVMRHQAGRQFRIHAYAIARVAGSLPVTCGDDAGPDVA